MRHSFLIVILISLLSTFSCNDGDIITISLDFDETFEIVAKEVRETNWFIDTLNEFVQGLMNFGKIN